METPSYFSTASIDRLSHKRQDKEWIKSHFLEDTTRFVPIWQLKNLVTLEKNRAPRYLSYHEIRPHLQGTDQLIFLGQQGQNMYFALELPSAEQSFGFMNAKSCAFEDLRLLSARLQPEECAVLAYARGMIYWRQRHQFCGSCGNPTTSSAAGFVRICTNAACGQQHFPRIDPSIIVLVSCGDACLLGRSPQWPPGMHSTIAGFVEPGECLEDAVRREVLEETGVNVANIIYFASDPWPFPSSLMLGFHAHATTTEITIDEHELEHAAWFTRAELKQQIAAKILRLPMKSSIAFRLIQAWYDDGQSGALQEIL